MVKIIHPGEARDLNLPGRRSLEIVSQEVGSAAVTLRLVEIPVPTPGESPRKPHRHTDFEECMYVLSGEGMTSTANGESAVAAGDTILVPAGEPHVTRNTGSEPLRMLCFFPTANCSEQK
ncbi:MAG: cupin domain-containing protein [Gammaproteobacteria bacterium]|nr:cupin domain-containing protein [Gammaproteobacteria bacterium]MDH3431564.1 cupin domain-containing protein [Gammaproteobacteria bacterium]MDH3433490.1 cupin domain-containing protein [Gammaproteobacteria bacterium]